MLIRPATIEDAPGMSAALGEFTTAGKRVHPDEISFVRTSYVADPSRIECSVAVDEDGTILGNQSLNLAEERPDYGAMEFRSYRTPDDLDCKVWRAEDNAP